MASAAPSLDKLLDYIIGFDFSEINRNKEDEISQRLSGETIARKISEISKQIEYVIQNITKSSFAGFTRDDLVRFKQKLLLIQELLYNPKSNNYYNIYINVGLKNQKQADVRNFWYSEEKLRIFIEQLEKHLDSTGSVAIRGAPLTSPILDEVDRVIDIVVDGQPLSLSGAVLTIFLEQQKATFICPITKKLMDDPVICSDGHTYERYDIEDWFKGKDISPSTKDPLANKNLIPNIALGQAIDAYKTLFLAKKAGAGYKRNKTKTGRKKSKTIRKSRKTKK